ncbi:MAG: cytochrome c biogenesis protein ResB [Phycisphaerales bacterium]|nr:cytochrome c biogenesis protein ResB [Phycisphaerales bacterium]
MAFPNQKALWVWAGIVALVLIGGYAAVGSGFASLRERMEMTEMAFFNWWPMWVLVVVLAVTLIVVTVRWIPLTWYTLGVWMVHGGILVLLAGSVWYFSQKHEGMVRIHLNQSVDEYYDTTERALYVYRVKNEEPSSQAGGTRPFGKMPELFGRGKMPEWEEVAMIPLRGLPIYRGHNPLGPDALDWELSAELFKDRPMKIVGYRPAGEEGGGAMVPLQMSGGGNLYVPFEQFVEVDLRGPEPREREVGDGFWFRFSALRRELPVEVKLTDFKAVKYAGAMDTYEDFVSTLEFTDKRTGEVKESLAHLNHPAMSHGFCFFQAAWDGKEEALPGERYSVLGVGNRPGLMTMTIGAILAFVGIGYAFYVKPILLRARRAEARSQKPEARRAESEEAIARGEA